MWRNVLLVKRYQIRGGFVQFLRLIRGCFGSVADSLPQIAWAAGFGHKLPLDYRNHPVQPTMPLASACDFGLTENDCYAAVPKNDFRTKEEECNNE
jgi:hypothetical protein